MTQENPIFISIFIPVFNGEKYLEATLNSIINQSYTNFEVLLVDDSSTDRSLVILNRFAEKDVRFKVFQKLNGGTVAKSMNFISLEITGDYFFYSSQDDIFSEDLLEKMIIRQVATQADSILPDMEFYFENQFHNKRIIGLNHDKLIELTGKEACEASLDWTIHGFALFRSSLIKEEFFPEDAFDSDEYVTRKLFLKSNKVVFSEGVFYYRQDNQNAITKTFGKKNFYILNTSWKLYELVKNNNFSETVVFKRQLGIMQQYFAIFSTYKTYEFELESDKMEIKRFLTDFKNKFSVNAFLFYNFKYVLRNLKWNYFLWIILFRTPFLFQTVIKFRKV